MSAFSSLDVRRVATVVVVLALAFLSGHLMQTVLRDDKPVASVPQGPDAAPVLESVEEPKPLPTPPAATLMPILERPPILPTRPQHPLGDETAVHRACDPRLFLTPAPAGTFTLAFRAPCDGGARVSIRQGPLKAAQTLDDTGRLSLRMPALSEDVTIDVTLGKTTLSSKLKVPGASDFQHVALIWDGPQMLRLNAYEFGAARNEIGHVWSGAPKTPTRASRGTGGFLTRLADEDGPSVEIYSLPSKRAPLRGVVRLVVEAEVTRDSCGRVVRARAIQPTPFRRVSETDVEVALPDCDRIGETVLLQNLLRDMRLAGR